MKGNVGWMKQRGIKHGFMKGNISLMDKRKRRNKEWIYERK